MRKLIYESGRPLDGKEVTTLANSMTVTIAEPVGEKEREQMQLVATLPEAGRSYRKTLMDRAEPFFKVVWTMYAVTVLAAILLLLFGFVTLADPSRAVAVVAFLTLLANMAMGLVLTANATRNKRAQFKVVNTRVLVNPGGILDIECDFINRGGRASAVWLEKSGLEFASGWSPLTEAADRLSPILKGTQSLAAGERAQFSACVPPEKWHTLGQGGLRFRLQPISGEGDVVDLQWETPLIKKPHNKSLQPTAFGGG